MKQLKETDNELIGRFRMEIQITIEEFKLIKAFLPEFSRKQIESNDFIIGWSELMPVVEKIADLYEESDHDRHWNKSVDKLRSSILFADIVVVHQAVVYFIRWYNTHNQTNNAK